HVGWYDHGNNFTEITTTCADNTQATNDGLANGASCKFDVGADLVVWTKHFSTFITYTVPTPSGGGGNSSGSSNSSPAPVVAPVGQVLGASIGPVAGCDNRTSGFSSTT